MPWLLHRQLRDAIPVNPKLYRPNKKWVISAEEREKALESRNKEVKERYDQGSHNLTPLKVGTQVRIQSGRRWSKSGRVVESHPNRQYTVRVDGSGRVTLRNRRFLRPDPSKPDSVTPMVVDPLLNQQVPVADQSQGIQGDSQDCQEPAPPETPTNEPERSLIPKAVRDLLSHNQRGLEEPVSDILPTRLRSGR